MYGLFHTGHYSAGHLNQPASTSTGYSSYIGPPASPYPYPVPPLFDASSESSIHTIAQQQSCTN